MARRGRRPRLGKTGCLFWLFIFLVIIVILLYRGRGTLKESISSFRKKVSGEKIVEKRPAPPIEEKDTTPSIFERRPTETTPTETAKEAQPGEETSERKKKEEQEAVRAKEEAQARIQQPQPLPAESSKGEKAIPEVKEKQLSTSIYYVKINKNDGTAKLYPVKKAVVYRDSPITRTIDTLLKGPTEDEKKEGITSFIPGATSLISARIQDGHLTLNFSNQFEENYSGWQAIHLELYQVLFTVFEFPQVNALSILIEGKKKQYITGEGIPLKAVYTKQDLSL